MAGQKFLSKAASLMLQLDEIELSSYFVRKFERSSAGEDNFSSVLGPSAPNSTPKRQTKKERTCQKEKGGMRFGNEFPGYFCKVCGKLQNPLSAKFRIRAKIRKRNRRKEKVEKCNIGEEMQQHRRRKSARKRPFISSKCHFCNHIQKLVCNPPTNFREEKQASRTKLINNYSNIAQDNKIVIENSSSAKALQKDAETPLNASRSSNRKKNRSRDTPLAKLLSEKKKKIPVSPSLKSFLFNS